MTKFTGIILIASVIILIGITSSMPLVVTAATLVACGTLLMALLSYFNRVPA